MCRKIAIANRGEIALRIVRACKEMNIESVVLHSDVDTESLAVLLADQSVLLGKAKAADSYLNIEKIIAAAKKVRADAIHPGYGFLSENAEFAKRCAEENIVFIGPGYEQIFKMGDKSEARRQMQLAGVPVVPGSVKATENAAESYQNAVDIGFPVMIKASSGGGGRGMRVVYDPASFKREFMMAKTEAEAAFNDGSMYIEKFIENPRHVEIQILADHFGQVVHLGERDCSVQRRNQKVIEEAPCTILDEHTRTLMTEAAIKAAQAVGYHNAGTVEFLVDKNMEFYFIEMNTRIQVEHPVTEMITNIDLIKEQIKIASGKKLSFTQDDIKFRGHAIECRINAEDSSHNFRPSPGRVEAFFMPGGYGIRVDSHLYNGYFVPPQYDSMIGKIIVWAETREEAIDRMRRALKETVISGISTNIDFQLEILENEDFIDNRITTGFIAQSLKRQIS